MSRAARWLRGCAGLALVALLAACGPRAADAGAAAQAAGDASAQPLTVFAAASLKEAMDAAAAAYEAEAGQPVQVSYAASSALARQIEQGAPADVFVSADLEWMDWLQARDLVDVATRRELLGNTLVLVAPASGDTSPVELAPGADLVGRLRGGCIALALTESVPAGKYAKAAFRSLGLWDALAPHVAEGDSVRAALMLVARGEAPLGVVYGSDAQAEPAVRVVATFPEDSHPPIVYPVARLARSPHPQAAAFVDWLETPPAQAIFRERGFALR
nr:molybdate ABC transporter substrate-binding protein [Luteimonas huabeiensis]